MKYTKKVPYFKKGDKIDKAARNLPKKQREAVLKVSSAQKEQERKDKLSSVGAGFRKPTAVVMGPVDTRSAQIENTVGQTAAKTRGQAFQAARKRGDSEFLWKGKRYHTRTAEEEAERKANTGNAGTDVPGQSFGSRRVSLGNGFRSNIGLNPKYVSSLGLSGNEVTIPRISPNYVFPEITEAEAKEEAKEAKTSKDKTSAGVEQSTPPWITRPVSDRYGHIVQGPAPRQITNRQQNRINIYVENNGSSDPKHYKREFVTDATGAQVPIYFSGTDPENLERISDFVAHDQAQKIFDKIDSGELKKQGGTINKFQRGTQGSGITRADLPKTSKWNILGIRPDAAKWFPTDRDLQPGQTEEVSRYMHRDKDITTLRRPRSYYTTNQPSMHYSTRTINWDNNTPVDTTYTYGNKVIQPNTIDYERYKAAFNGGDRALLQNIGKHQQGGEVQQQPQMTEEDLITDFTVRYLSALGVAPEDIMDQEGNLNPVYVEEITNVFKQGDIDWESYVASPDEYIQQFVGSRMQMARKGAKLKRLSQLRTYKK